MWFVTCFYRFFNINDNSIRREDDQWGKRAEILSKILRNLDSEKHFVLRDFERGEERKKSNTFSEHRNIQMAFFCVFDLCLVSERWKWHTKWCGEWHSTPFVCVRQWQFLCFIFTLCDFFNSNVIQIHSFYFTFNFLHSNLPKKYIPNVRNSFGVVKVLIITSKL